MSHQKTIYTHELRVVFEEDEDARITWRVEADGTIGQVLNTNCEELTEAGAPLAVLGVKVLYELLCEQTIELALNKADNYRWRNLFRRIEEVAENGTAQLQEPGLQLVH